jgi:L-cysteine desulfidase
MSENYGIQGDESEADGRKSNQRHKGPSNNQDIIKSIQNDVDRNSEERPNQDKEETTSDNSEDKNEEGKHSQINTKMVVSQELECDDEKKGANKDKTMTLEHSQDIIDNTQFESIHKIVETCRSSARNKKTPSIRGNNFYGE